MTQPQLKLPADITNSVSLFPCRLMSILGYRLVGDSQSRAVSAIHFDEEVPQLDEREVEREEAVSVLAINDCKVIFCSATCHVAATWILA